MQKSSEVNEEARVWGSLRYLCKSGSFVGARCTNFLPSARDEAKSRRCTVRGSSAESRLGNPVLGNATPKQLHG
jgi:hypothetical protein